MEITLTVEFSEDVKKFLKTMLNGKATKPAVEEEEDEAEEEEEEEVKPKKKVVKKKVEEEEEEETEEEDDEATYTVERVREKCQKLIQDGKAAKLKALLGEFGAAKVVNLKPKDFDKFMAKANKIK